MNEQHDETPPYLKCFCGYIGETRWEMGQHLHGHIGSQWLGYTRPKQSATPRVKCFCGFTFSLRDQASGEVLSGALQSHFEKMGGPVAHFLEHQLEKGK